MKSFTLKAMPLLMVVALSACGKNPGNGEAYQSGSDHCSQQFIQDTRALNITDDAAINTYESKYKDVRCKAIDERTGEETYAEANQIVAAARSVAAAVRGQGGSGSIGGSTQTPVGYPQLGPPVNSPSSGTAQTPTYGTIDLNQSVTSGATVTIKSASVLNQFKYSSSSGSDYVFQKGAPIRISNLTDRTNNVCMVVVGLGGDLKDGEQVAFKSTDVKVEADNLTLTNPRMMISCFKVGDAANTQWTAKDVQDIFRNVLSITPARR